MAGIPAGDGGGGQQSLALAQRSLERSHDEALQAALRRRRLVLPSSGPIETLQQKAEVLHEDILNVVGSATSGTAEVEFTRDSDRGLRAWVFGPPSHLYWPIFDDFVWNGGANNGWQHDTSGAGSSVFPTSIGVDATEKCQGVMALTIGAVAGARAAIHRGGSSILLGQGSAFVFESRFAVSALSNTTDEYAVHCGLIDNPGSNAEPTDGAAFVYRRDVNGDVWVCQTRSNGSETPTVTAVAVVAGVHSVFQIEINAAGTSIVYSIDGAVVAVHLTNIPTGAGRQTGFGHRIYRTAGASNSRALYLDWTRIEQSATGAR